MKNGGSKLIADQHLEFSILNVTEVCHMKIKMSNYEKIKC